MNYEQYHTLLQSPAHSRCVSYLQTKNPLSDFVRHDCSPSRSCQRCFNYSVMLKDIGNSALSDGNVCAALIIVLERSLNLRDTKAHFVGWKCHQDTVHVQIYAPHMEKCAFASVTASKGNNVSVVKTRRRICSESASKSGLHVQKLRNTRPILH